MAAEIGAALDRIGVATMSTTTEQLVDVTRECFSWSAWSKDSHQRRLLVSAAVTVR